MRKTLSLMLILLCAVAIIGFARGKKEVVTIDFWLYGGTPQNVALYHQLVDTWNKDHPNTQVKITDQVWATVFEHYQAAIASGNQPDVARIHSPGANQFGAVGGYLEPLDNFKDWATVKAQYVQGYLSAYTIKGHVWALPNTPAIFVLLGNKAMFDKAGIAKMPETWTEFRADAKKLTVPGKQWGYAIMGGDLGGMAYRLAPLAFEAGGLALSEDWTKSNFNTPPWIQTVQLLADMYQKDKSVDPGWLSAGFDEVANKFAADKVAMSIEGPWYSGVINAKKPGKELLIGVVPRPDSALGPAPQGSLFDASAVVISSKSKHKAEAWEWMKYMTGPVADANFAKDPNLGGLPVVTASLSLPEWPKYLGYEAYAASGPTVRAWPYHPSLTDIVQNVLAVTASRAIKGDMTVEKAFQQIDDQTNAILQKK